MGTSWNDLSESEKAEMRSRASSIRDEAAGRREEFEAREKEKKMNNKSSFLESLLAGLFRSLERTANNISKRR
ncbi:MAG: hypothetical protein J6C11_10885 [Spirochaetaceae bacterium]|nr:hypothetical protein [Spirochaetaceae bacterium]